MAIRVYRVAVLGCPRAVIAQEASGQDRQSAFHGIGKSCLCNRFVRPEAYSETEHSSVMDEETWMGNCVFNGDHFIYWGAANKHLHDGTKVRFQVVEHTEFYADPAKNGGRLVAHPASQDYLSRASSNHFQSRTAGKEAYRLRATDEATKRTRGPVRTRQLFPNEDFAGNGGKKSMGIYGYICVFDPTLEDKQMQKQLTYLSALLSLLKKRKLVIACVKCDAVDVTKIRFGANRASEVLKKTIPFVEVSARDSVNVEDAFFALVSLPKKPKLSKSGGGRRSSPFLSYHEVIESRKSDLNRAKDAYRKLLQRKVNDFSCQWRQMQPELQREPDYQLVVSLTATESSEEIVKRMFQMRLIEIKLLEANQKFGSTAKKANKDRSSAHQIYLSEALRSHPDLGTDSMYDYVYSPGHSVSGDTENCDTEELTEPSTPSSHPTPDINGSILSGICENGTAATATATADPRPRSATVPEMLVTMPSYDTSTLPPKQTSDVLSPKMSTSLPRQPFVFANEKEPPPLPPRDTAAMGTLKKNKTQSQPFLENTTKPRGTLKRESEVRRLSNSMDCLLLPEEDSETSQSGTSFNKLEAEPYLRPSEVKRMMDRDDRNASIFMSMRVSGKSRPVLPTFQNSVDSPESMKRSRSFERGHKRSQSNPFILDLLISKAVPPELPPRNTDLPPPVPSRRSPQHRSSRSPPPLPPTGNDETFESSLEFGNTGGRVSVVSRISRTRSPQAVVRDLKEHTFNTNTDEDNISTISGPFEEIDAEKPSSVGDQSLGGGIARDISSHTLPSQQVNEEDDDDDNDQYARIEDITKDQQYIAMAPAPANVKGATLPAQKGSYLSGDDFEEEEGGGVKRGRSQSQATAPPTPKKDSGVLARTVRRFRKQRTEPTVRESTDSPSPPPPPAHNFSSSILSSPNRHTLPRPLPPSPTKGTKAHFNTASRKQSSGPGSNIYETIDEDLLSRVMGKQRRQMTTKDDSLKASLALPVSPSMMSQYLQVVQKFFSLPEIQEKWVETVREIMPDEDAEDIPPPYYNTTSEKVGQQQHNLSHIKSRSGHHDDEQIPVVVPQGSSTPLSESLPPSSNSLVLSPSSPFQSPRHAMMVKTGAGSSSITNSPLVKRQASRDGLIELINQQLRHQESSDSETDSDEEAGVEESSDSESSDSDIEQSEQLQHHKPTTADNIDRTDHFADTNHITHTDQTDLDEALGMRNSMSTDSDHIETDPIVKFPQSVSVEELEIGEKGEGMIEDLGVQPLHSPSKIDQKSGGDLKVASGSRTLSDSGISNQENVQSETEC